MNRKYGPSGVGLPSPIIKKIDRVVNIEIVRIANYIRLRMRYFRVSYIDASSTFSDSPKILRLVHCNSFQWE